MVYNSYAVRCILTTRSTNVRRADSGGKACQAADSAAAHAAMLRHVGPCCHVASAVSQRGALRCGRVGTRCSGRVATRCSGRACQVVEVGRIAHTRRQPDFVLIRISAHREGTHRYSPVLTGTHRYCTLRYSPVLGCTLRYSPVLTGTRLYPPVLTGTHFVRLNRGCRTLRGSVSQEGVNRVGVL